MPDSLRAGRRIKGGLRVFPQGLVAVPFNRGKMRKQVLAARIRGDKAEPFAVVEPFLYLYPCLLLL